jgi:hypothetical protein
MSIFMHIKINMPEWILFALLLLLTRQAQFEFLTNITLALSALSILVYLDLKKSAKLLVVFLFYISISGFFSAIFEYKFDSVIRFYAILSLTLLVFYSRFRISNLGFVSLPIILQSLIVILISCYLALSQDPVIASGVRNFVLENGWGDVYSFDGFYYRTQLRGNALIPLFYLIFLFKYNECRTNKVFYFISLFALIFAGNATYLFVCFFATILKVKKLFSSHFIRYVMLFLILALAIFYSGQMISFLIETKFSGDQSSSSAVRLDQINSYLNSISMNPISILFGKGIGACFPSTNLIDYCNSNYIELQILNIAHQIGVVGIFLYLYIVWYLSKSQLNKEGFVLLWLYFIMSCTNPYIFDMNQIIATMIILTLFSRVKELPPTREGNGGLPFKLLFLKYNNK